MAFSLQWDRVSAELYLSRCGRYAVHQAMGMWLAAHWSGSGWGLLASPAESQREAQDRCSQHLWGHLKVGA